MPKGLERDVARAGAALDGGGVETIKRELVADFFKQAQLCLGQRSVCGGDIAGERIGCLIECFGEIVADKPEEGIKAVFLSEKIKHHLCGAVHAVDVIGGKDWQHIDRVFDFDELGCANIFIGG